MAINTPKTFNGWTLGAGLDYAVTDHIFGHLEYHFTDYSSKSIEDLVDVGLKQNAVSVGIGFKF